MREWYVKWGAIMVAAYIIFGMARFAHSDLAYEIGNNPREIVENVNVVVPATSRNCKKVSKYVHDIMYRCQYSELKVIGVWTAGRGHMFVAFKDVWGKTNIITTSRNSNKWKTVLIKVDSIEQFCNMWDNGWSHYFVYRKNHKVLTKRIR